MVLFLIKKSHFKKILPTLFCSL